MKTLLVTLFLIFGFTCSTNSNKDSKIAVSDCGITIESPYLADDLLFTANEDLVVAIRLIQAKRVSLEHDFSTAELDTIMNGLNRMYESTHIKFALIEYVIDTAEVDIQMNDYRNRILTYKRLHSQNLPAIDVFIYPMDFNYYPGVALAIKSDGIAIQKKFITSNTLAHEIGHCLGLHHTHQGSGEGYKEGDFICDTPSTGIISDLVDANCNYDENKKPNNLSEEEMDIIIRNYMSYVNRDCRKEFTKDQIDKMRYNLAKEPMLRNTLIF